MSRKEVRYWLDFNALAKLSGQGTYRKHGADTAMASAIAIKADGGNPVIFYSTLGRFSVFDETKSENRLHIEELSFQAKRFPS